MLTEQKTYVTGSTKEISASNGPVPMSEPFNDKSNPSSEMFLCQYQFLQHDWMNSILT